MIANQNIRSSSDLIREHPTIQMKDLPSYNEDAKSQTLLGSHFWEVPTYKWGRTPWLFGSRKPVRTREELTGMNIVPDRIMGNDKAVEFLLSAKTEKDIIERVRYYIEEESRFEKMSEYSTLSNLGVGFFANVFLDPLNIALTIATAGVAAGPAAIARSARTAARMEGLMNLQRARIISHTYATAKPPSLIGKSFSLASTNFPIQPHHIQAATRLQLGRFMHVNAIINVAATAAIYELDERMTEDITWEEKGIAAGMTLAFTYALGSLSFLARHRLADATGRYVVMHGQAMPAHSIRGNRVGFTDRGLDTEWAEESIPSFRQPRFAGALEDLTLSGANPARYRGATPVPDKFGYKDFRSRKYNLTRSLGLEPRNAHDVDSFEIVSTAAVEWESRVAGVPGASPVLGEMTPLITELADNVAGIRRMEPGPAKSAAVSDLGLDLSVLLDTITNETKVTTWPVTKILFGLMEKAREYAPPMPDVPLRTVEDLRGTVLQMGADIQDIKSNFREVRGSPGTSAVTGRTDVEDMRLMRWREIRKDQIAEIADLAQVAIDENVPFNVSREGRGMDGFGMTRTEALDKMELLIEDVIHQTRDFPGHGGIVDAMVSVSKIVRERSFIPNRDAYVSPLEKYWEYTEASYLKDYPDTAGLPPKSEVETPQPRPGIIEAEPAKSSGTIAAEPESPLPPEPPKTLGGENLQRGKAVFEEYDNL